jgi:hypothetical protein
VAAQVVFIQQFVAACEEPTDIISDRRVFRGSAIETARQRKLLVTESSLCCGPMDEPARYRSIAACICILAPQYKALHRSNGTEATVLVSYTALKLAARVAVVSAFRTQSSVPIATQLFSTFYEPKCYGARIPPMDWVELAELCFALVDLQHDHGRLMIAYVGGMRGVNRSQLL